MSAVNVSDEVGDPHWLIMLWVSG